MKNGTLVAAYAAPVSGLDGQGGNPRGRQGTADQRKNRGELISGQDIRGGNERKGGNYSDYRGLGRKGERIGEKGKGEGEGQRQGQGEY